MYAHYALHRLKILPGQLLALPRRERAFIYASIDLQIEKEKKEAAAEARRWMTNLDRFVEDNANRDLSHVNVSSAALPCWQKL